MDTADLDELLRDVARDLWAAWSNSDDRQQLIFPVKRDRTRRVSEQESKILLCHELNKGRWPFSIETPTTEVYQQKGHARMSARLDVTVYGSRNPEDRVLNVELKAGNPDEEDFRKDVEKLVREGVDGLWFHTLEEANPRTWCSLFSKIRESFRLLGDAPHAAQHGVTFAFCLLSEPKLYVSRLPLGAGADAHLDGLLGATPTGWTEYGPTGDGVIRSPPQPEQAGKPTAAR